MVVPIQNDVNIRIVAASMAVVVFFTAVCVVVIDVKKQSPLERFYEQLREHIKPTHAYAHCKWQ